MLSYSVRINNDNIKMEELVWTERYASPDLSFMSGVTSQDYGIELYNKITASSNDGKLSSLNVSCENVTRNGYIVIKDKEYPVEDGAVLINGVYYYTTDKSKITVNNWLKEQWKKVGDDYKSTIVEGDAEVTIADNVVKLDTIVWIEDDTVTIDGHKYIFDRYINSVGGIKYYEQGAALEPKEITKCDSIVYHYFNTPAEYKKVTKFILTKDPDEIPDIDRIAYCSYFYYVEHDGYYNPVRLVDDETNKKCYICEIDSHPYEVKYEKDDGEEEAVTTDIIPRFNNLKEIAPYIKYDDDSKSYVQWMIQNANMGDEMAIYLSDGLNVFVDYGDLLTLTSTIGNNTIVPVLDEEGTNKKFIIYDNDKVYVKPNIADMVKINGIEYDIISYPDGKVDGKDAIVRIDDNTKVPMQITSGKTKLKRYGKAISGGSNQAVDMLYTIKSYSGVVINDTVYRVHESSVGIEGEAPDTQYYVETDIKIPYKFRIVDIIGSSMLVCVPEFSTLEYDTDFINDIRVEICRFFVSNSGTTKVSIPNKSFGIKRPIDGTRTVNGSVANSSNDYYNPTNLTLYTNTGTISIQFPMEINIANNILQEEIINRDFVDAETKKAINPIIDMEKDVYYPKFMEAEEESDKADYKGSRTNFNDIEEIIINMHFRTRNMENWKINNEYDNFMIKDVGDNWFCTDFFPYNELLTASTNDNKYDEVIMNASDLMGLLWFTNDDIFYQRDKIAKSFLRLSYYDSPDPNSQNLLATSTVFMDEHAIYKKYTDNSRKNVSDYGIIHEPIVEFNETSKKIVLEDPSTGEVTNRIDVLGEYINKHDPKVTSYCMDGCPKADIYAKNIIGSMTSDNNRVSSRISIKSKYATDTSSEGFYIYMFKEYSEKLRPKPIYMKIDFNHAGIGKTIPLAVPMKWEKPKPSSEEEPTKDNSYYPVRKMTLSNNNEGDTGDTPDLEVLKMGYKLSYIQSQYYIPLYAVYDFKNKEYAYVFDDRYITRDGDKVSLNLFELKVMDESNKTATDDELKDVTNNNIERAVINVNTKQFDKNSFNRNVV